MRSPRSIQALLLASALLTVTGGSSLAATVVSSSGTPGDYHVTDSSANNGVTCTYDHLTGALTAITVRGPRLFAKDDFGQWVGWRFIIQRTTGSAGGSWVQIKKGAVHEAWATSQTKPAKFGPRTWTLPGPLNHEFRVEVALYWYHFSENGPPPVEGVVTLRLRHYADVFRATTYHPTSQFCEGYFS
jgi:hypothetical protein